MTPVALFAYARPETLEQTISCLRNDRVPKIYAFCDAPARRDLAERALMVRRLIRAIDWCDVEIIQRSENLGLGRSIRDGVERVLAQHDSVLVVEDDLVFVPGAYAYLSTALDVFRDDNRVLSVTGWTRADLTPPGIVDQPYFDGRSSSWLWGCWRRSWTGMNKSAVEMIRECESTGVDPRAYGCDLYRLARYEETGNTWAVRFMYNHIRTRTLSLHPPHSLVEHIGFIKGSVHNTEEKHVKWLSRWGNPPLQPCPQIPVSWPEPVEHPGQRDLWQDKCGRYSPLPLHRRILDFLGIR